MNPHLTVGFVLVHDVDKPLSALSAKLGSHAITCLDPFDNDPFMSKHRSLGVRLCGCFSMNGIPVNLDAHYDSVPNRNEIGLDSLICSPTANEDSQRSKCNAKPFEPVVQVDLWFGPK